MVTNKNYNCVVVDLTNFIFLFLQICFALNQVSVAFRLFLSQSLNLLKKNFFWQDLSSQKSLVGQVGLERLNLIEGLFIIL